MTQIEQATANYNDAFGKWHWVAYSTSYTQAEKAQAARKMLIANGKLVAAKATAKEANHVG